MKTRRSRCAHTPPAAPFVELPPPHPTRPHACVASRIATPSETTRSARFAHTRTTRMKITRGIAMQSLRGTNGCDVTSSRASSRARQNGEPAEAAARPPRRKAQTTACKVDML
eukprot:355908-Chlamydomonas_euryale.AAC.8